MFKNKSLSSNLWILATNLTKSGNPKSIHGNRRPKFSEGPPKIYRTGHNLKVSQSRSRLIKWKKSV